MGHDKLDGKGAVVTGAGGGIGKALAARLVAEGATVVVNDLNAGLVEATATEIGAYAVPGDCSSADGVAHLVATATEHLEGRGVTLDVYCANAGIDRTQADSLQASDEDWAAMIDTNVMSHVRAARLLAPRWAERHEAGEEGGRFVVTASAAGLLTMIGAAPYSVTKHAAVGFAEWLSITYGGRGVAVQAICPQGVRTAMLEQAGPLKDLLSHDDALTPEQVADAWVEALDDEHFLVFPHPEVKGYYQARAADTDRWLGGMRRLQSKVDAFTGTSGVAVMTAEALQGLDLDAYRRWYDDVRPGEITGDLSGSLIAGGKSNLTYEVTDGSSAWIVRRPPLGHVQATAHDMGREFTAMSALGGTDVPVPVMHAHCADPDVLGAEFYVMSKIDGTAYRTAEQLAPLGPEVTGRLAGAMVDVLATLHAVDPQSVGLGEFGRPAGFLSRQVRRWGRQLEGSATRPLPDAETLLARLADTIPADDADRDASTSAIVHGDYRLDNLLSLPDHDQPVRAVVDWEMATIGDPLTDVALLLVYDKLGTLVGGSAVADASSAPGYPDERTQLERYVTASGRDLPDLAFHLGLAYLKIAVILEGIHHRFVAGQTLGGGFDTVGQAVEPLLAAGLDATAATRSTNEKE